MTAMASVGIRASQEGPSTEATVPCKLSAASRIDEVDSLGSNLGGGLWSLVGACQPANRCIHDPVSHAIFLHLHQLGDECT